MQQQKQHILLYIVHHDDASGKTAQDYAIKLQETQPGVLALPMRVSDTSPFFESQVFDHMDLSTHARFEWIGVITHSFEKKLGPLPPTIEIEVAKGQEKGADVISLFNLDFSKPRVNRPVSFIESIAMQHGPFMWMAIHHIFKLQGYSERDIMDKNIHGFFSNWWLAKPHVMEKYVKFFKQCKNIVQVHPLVSSYINEDGYYLGYGHKQTVDTEKIRKIFNRDYYCLHPFLFERMPAIFFHVEKHVVYRGGVTFAWHLGD